MRDIPKEVIVDASKGDMRAFEQIYNAASRLVYNVALRATRTKEDAEEASQDTFLKIYKNLKKFRFESSFKTWIYRIAVNSAINVNKKKSFISKRQIQYDDTVEREYMIRRTDKNAANEACSEESIAELLNALNAKERMCVILRSLEGLSYREIAVTLNININTVRTRLRRARRKLLICFKKRGGES